MVWANVQFIFFLLFLMSSGVSAQGDVWIGHFGELVLPSKIHAKLQEASGSTRDSREIH